MGDVALNPKKRFETNSLARLRFAIEEVLRHFDQLSPHRKILSTLSPGPLGVNLQQFYLQVAVTHFEKFPSTLRP